ncbi:Uncharacterized conserved protein YqhQ [Lachnospiraceae bacterium XBB2008]|nr:Uncharacterized conserved protein YqhQ [Lachnospiraceae bacterium XBB2008]
MSKKGKKHYSGIGGQAVLEGIMMKNKEHYSIAVRKSDGSIAVDIENYRNRFYEKYVSKIPFVRGVFSFADSLILGMRSLNFSADIYAEEEGETPGKNDKFMTTIVGIISVVLAVGLFMVLPVYLTGFVADRIRNDSLIAIIEGAIRLAIFLIYIVAISLMKDIRRVYMYHGAEHKCINCIERGRPLTVHNVMRSSRMHRRCGTSFLLFVVLVSIIVFFFIRVDNMFLKIVIRIALIPVIAGISYELLRFAGKYDNPITYIISAPGMLLQRLTTREPDESMAEVAISAVEAVFDWREFLLEEFGYDYTGEDDGPIKDEDGDGLMDEDDDGIVDKDGDGLMDEDADVVLDKEADALTFEDADGIADEDSDGSKGEDAGDAAD